MRTSISIFGSPITRPLVCKSGISVDDTMKNWPESLKIKTYRSSSGLPILVGQDDYSNDYLTFKVAAAEDLWFHVNGAPGSHVLVQSRGDDVDKQTISEAAALAAWFSKLRQGGTVSVHYLPAKHIRKPRGAKPGSVHIKQAKKIKVKPSDANQTEEVN
ncbi:MAG: DUF814 domain-containing protein [Caldithrix sp.]|nr:DUF814 domain-containing protein [Caldithrix sp.]